MQITLVNNNYDKGIRLIGDEQTVNIYSEHPGEIADNKDTMIILEKGRSQTGKLDGKGFLIAGAGEYENNGVYILAEEIDSSIKVLAIEIDGIRVMYYSNSDEISREQLSHFGISDILVLELAGDYSAQLRTIQLIDPQVILPLSSDLANLEKFKHELGIEFVPVSKYKVKSTEFENSEYVLRGVSLQN